MDEIHRVLLSVAFCADDGSSVTSGSRHRVHSSATARDAPRLALARSSEEVVRVVLVSLLLVVLWFMLWEYYNVRVCVCLCVCVRVCVGVRACAPRAVSL